MGAAVVVALVAFTSLATAETIAIVFASPASDEAARYFRTQVDQSVPQIETANARDLEALVREARRRWRKDLIVVIDADRATVSVVRPWDGTISSRALDLRANSAPYAVALAAVE